jgi:hypothetical protein
MQFVKVTSLFVLLAASFLMPTIASAKVKKAERDLVLITHLDVPGSDSVFWKAVYSFVEKAGVSTAVKHLKGDYRAIHIIQTRTKDKKKKATLEKVVALFDRVASRKATKAIDVIWMTHGLKKGRISLQHPTKKKNKTLSVRDDIAPALSTALGQSGIAKLRMLYSTACFGKSAIDGWRTAGFKVVSGGRKVYTDSASSQPKFLRAWKKGSTFRNSVNAANKAQKLDLWDKLVSLSKKYDKEDLDSFRVIKGAGCIKLNSNPSKKCK